jgi:hypothetical protein
MPFNRPDFSEYVGHFTKDAAPFVSSSIPAESPTITEKSAYNRLISILQTQRILATPMPWTKRQAVAFTECPWGSLIDHSNKYSPFGIGFAKAQIFAAGGGPALYLRPDLTEKQQSEFQHKDFPDRKGFHPHLWAFVTPFVPQYAPQSFLDDHWAGKSIVDYTHEREWRVPHDFTFRLDQIKFVVVESYDDMARFPREVKDKIGRDRFLILDVYKQIERLWPVHIIGGP